MFAKLSPRKRDESGAVAILVAALAVIILMFAAYAVDIGLQVNRKHQLIAALDAAAQAGAAELPGNSVKAKTEALAFAKAHDPTETGALAPNVDFWCIVASVGSSAPYAVDTTQIPSTCNPGTGPWPTGSMYKGTNKISCSEILCAIPCVEPTPNNATPKIACNAIRVFQGRDVPFTFARSGGIQKGSTGTVLSVACKGSCGTISPNPLDVAVVADRTGSMGATDIAKMRDGIKAMLKVMTPDQQYVSLGAIGRSAPTTTGQQGSCDGSSQGLTWPSETGSSGNWMPISFSNNYVEAGTNKLNPDSALVKGVDCLTTQSSGTQGTALAAPMKAAAQYLLGENPEGNNLGALLPARSLPAKKMIIFETDGQPNEKESTRGSTDLGSGDVFSNTDRTAGPDVVDPAGPEVTTTEGSKTYITRNVIETYTYIGGNTACQNLIEVAANAKARGIIVVMIGYNMASKKCNDYDPAPTTKTVTKETGRADGGNTIYRTVTTKRYVDSGSTATVLSVLAAAASSPEGMLTGAQNNCANATERTAENSDGDYLFCGASGTDMAPIFKTALTQVTKGIKLMRMP